MIYNKLDIEIDKIYKAFINNEFINVKLIQIEEHNDDRDYYVFYHVLPEGGSTSFKTLLLYKLN